MNIWEKNGINERDTRPRDRFAELDAKFEALVTYQGLTVRDLGGGVFEVVKDEMPTGDYTNPIRWVQGMTVELGKWYYDTDPLLPKECKQAGVAEAFDLPWLEF